MSLHNSVHSDAVKVGDNDIRGPAAKKYVVVQPVIITRLPELGMTLLIEVQTTTMLNVALTIHLFVVLFCLLLYTFHPIPEWAMQSFSTSRLILSSVLQLEPTALTADFWNSGYQWLQCYE